MNSKLLLAAAVATVMGYSAQAQVEIRLTGSTAFRADVYRAVRGMYTPGFSENVAGAVPASGANRMTWTGTMPAFGVQTVTVRASWSGAVDGIQTLAQNLSKTFLATSTSGDTTLTLPLSSDFAFTDNLQANTAFTTPTLETIPVGIIPFVVAKSVVTPASVLNVTLQQLQAIFGLGILPLGQFTGDINDFAVNMNYVGRDTGSGTRVVFLAESKYGVFTPATFRKLNLPGGITGTFFVDDSVGFASGGNVKNVLNVATTTEPAIGVLSVNDAASLTTPATQILKYNGVAYTADAVRNGQYSLWSTELMMNRPGFLVGNLLTFRGANLSTPNSFLKSLDTELAVSAGGLQLGSMNVSRAAEGGPITP